MFRKLSLEQHCSKREDKGGSVTGEFSEIGQNQAKLGKTERATFPFTSLLVVSQLQLITLNQMFKSFSIYGNKSRIRSFVLEVTQLL